MRKPLFQKICIIGVGLIGGSLGMAVKKRKVAKLVIGVVRRKETIREAFAKKAIDVATLDIIDGVRDADVVILCAPASTIVSQLKTIAPHLKKGALVIDVGSSKTLIEKEAAKVFKKNIFIGCHPMAGSESCGIEHASANLFEKSVCFMTKPNAKISQFWKTLGAIPIVMDAKSHDEWVATASHLPHLLAFSLFQNFKQSSKKFPLNPSLQNLARIAKSNPELWADIFLSNREAVLASMNSFEKSLLHFKKALSTKNIIQLKSIITKANRSSPSHA